MVRSDEVFDARSWNSSGDINKLFKVIDESIANANLSVQARDNDSR